MHSQSNGKAPFDSERLIEEIKRYPVLYDPASDKYKNIEYKEKIWRQISLTVQAKGGIEQCKRKWASFRDQLRRTLSKRKKSGRVIRKYKFEDNMAFLLPFLVETDNLRFDDEEDDDELMYTDTQDDTQSYQLDGMVSIKQESDKDLQGQLTVESCFQSPATSWDGNLAPAEKYSNEAVNFVPEPAGEKYFEGRAQDPTSSPRSRSRSPVRSRRSRSPASQLMAYLLAEKMAEKKMNTNLEKHPVDIFLSGLAPSLKSLSPILLNEAKGKIFAVVQEVELKQLTEMKPHQS
ncbi:Hypothetical protein NTJ_10338 [Nesidiocoris tenuis]|uniref:MADF domain-containing protein n=1 Tax=Nesidiocoris tenuis TaxID=355587 RepID=A0ABN7AZC5_9HEMI|nr:Hypothetical protein NTJ_10338 [Nesidiocoris tenuis]